MVFSLAGAGKKYVCYAANCKQVVLSILQKSITRFPLSAILGSPILNACFVFSEYDSYYNFCSTTLFNPNRYLRIIFVTLLYTSSLIESFSCTVWNICITVSINSTTKNCLRDMVQETIITTHSFSTCVKFFFTTF